MKPLPNSSLSVLFYELALFLHSGAGYSSAFLLLADECEDEKLKSAFRMVSENLDSGATLADSLRQSKLIPEDACSMIEVSEKTGKTESALSSLSDYYEQRDITAKRIKSAVFYPSVLLCVMLAVIAVLLVKVLPIFDDVYASLGTTMTGVAGALLTVGSFLGKITPALLAVIAFLSLAAIVVSLTPALRGAAGKIFSKITAGSDISKKYKRARFAVSLSMALSGGLDSESACETAALLFEGDEWGEKCKKAAELTRNGTPINESLRKNELLPPSECKLLSIGMQSGNGEAAADEIAKRLTREADEALEKKISAIEPALVIVTSVLIGMILLAVMLPLTEIMAGLS